MLADWLLIVGVQDKDDDDEVRKSHVVALKMLHRLASARAYGSPLLGAEAADVDGGTAAAAALAAVGISAECPGAGRTASPLLTSTVYAPFAREVSAAMAKLAGVDLRSISKDIARRLRRAVKALSAAEAE